MYQIIDISKYADFFVKAYGWYDNPDCVFIVMEYFEHGDLDAYMKQLGQPLPESEVTRIVSQLAEGLDLVHRSRFVHRDIKPAVSTTIALTKTKLTGIEHFYYSERTRLGSQNRRLWL